MVKVGDGLGHGSTEKYWHFCLPVYCTLIATVVQKGLNFFHNPRRIVECAQRLIGCTVRPGRSFVDDMLWFPDV